MQKKKREISNEKIKRIKCNKREKGDYIVELILLLKVEK